ncbi:NUDIX hydrolase [Spirosoma endophyticum]|uniref:ADP-ribose pyrophosphatase YjhB, NUDIX family n=1 Tax=Spirosoma endophyticum TaxID=662367 RepID=A0A1I1ERA6_9BACT|nr:NUDIX domain-containing protein [Spirosoma endophyticum]SFB89192.1 ADP-ribose pyrophosphatase YjhB, NUDIX family [Spirosoma endophyticum]
MIEYNPAAARYYQEVSEQCIHYLSIDGVIFGFHQNQLKVLLLRWKGTEEWSLPGGFIRKAESVDVAAQRIMQERTGLNELYLHQFHVFGEAVRYNQEETWRKINLPIQGVNWSERTISLGYYALVDHSKVVPTPDFLTEECRWWSLDQIPALLFDHNYIINVALASLRKQLNDQPINHLLPEAFTIPELQRLHETILGYPLDARNFYKKTMASGSLERLSERRAGTPHKAPYLYRFNLRPFA